MSLFRKLLHLHSDSQHRLEDFHTEIVAHVLREDPELALAWLRTVGITDLLTAEIVISTQQSFRPIPGLHSAGSKPDFVIRLCQGSRTEVIFIESKVGSTEKNEQLPKYLGQLGSLQSADRRTLLFITRDYEPKTYAPTDQVDFEQARWSDFYRFLSRSESRETRNQLLTFMKEHNMSQGDRFSPLDLLALTNHRRARSLLDATMWEKTNKTFADVCGASGSSARAMGQLRRHNRYVMAAGHGDGYQFEFLLGYWFPDDQPAESPRVGMHMQVNPKSAARDAIVQAMYQFAETTRAADRQWGHWNLNDTRSWGGLGCTVNLEDFLADGSHVAAIVKWFDSLLQDVAEFRRLHPELPWSARAAAAAEEE